MYGCFGRTTFGTKEILDGVVLIFMKTLFQAFVTNRLIAVFMAKYEGTQLFNDSADFGWLYGMTPVAPTVYMFAELYGVHSDFMALFANVCMMAAITVVLLGRFRGQTRLVSTPTAHHSAVYRLRLRAVTRCCKSLLRHLA